MVVKIGPYDISHPVIVRFTSRRDEMLCATKKLYIPRGGSDSGNEAGVFISEYLTRGVASLFFKARKLVRENELASARTNKGLVNVKFTAIHSGH